ncbi:MAG: caspase family protein [Spirochaetales bacterium]|nr:caspase family protein [Spirochaetales bacterium]
MINQGKYIFIILLFTFTAQLMLSAESRDPEELTLRRFALIIGANDGGKERVKLKYATKDAISFARVMEDLGAVRKEDTIMLLDPKIADIEKGFNTLKGKVSDALKNKGRNELLVYYSGHSDEEGLLLYGELYTYKSFRDDISSIKTDVRVAILDSCSSGSFTRAKGVIKRPAFLLDESNEMKGYAFLTSSAEDEAAQESERMQGSFFTHFLVTGLRGAADTTSDNMVTLNEVYSYAYKETLARTEKTQYGPQHPKYDIQLTGTGDLVLTDLRELTAGLQVGEDIGGKLYIRDGDGNLVAEITKTQGRSMELGLEPGTYTLTLEQDGQYFQTNFILRDGARKLLAKANLQAVSSEITQARGDEGKEDTLEQRVQDLVKNEMDDETNQMEEDTALQNTDIAHSLTDEREISMTFTAMPAFDDSGVIDPHINSNFSLNLLIGSATNISGFQMSTIGNYVFNGLTGFQGSSIYNITNGDLAGFQGSSIYNYTGGNFQGFQGSGVANIIDGSLDGMQVAGIYNYTGNNGNSFQLSGICNSNDVNMAGLQIAGIYNQTGKKFSGAQLSGIANYAEEVYGTQIAGITNVTDTLYGAQIGLVNVAGKANGTQIGLINISDSSEFGLPIGLLNFTKDGFNHLEAVIDQSGITNVNLKFGSKYLYTIFTGGLLLTSDPMYWTYGLGIGINIPINQLFLNIDFIAHSVHKTAEDWYVTDLTNFMPQARLLFGIRIGQWVGVFGGVACNMVFPTFFDYSQISSPLQFETVINGTPVKFLPKFFAGIQL